MFVFLFDAECRMCTGYEEVTTTTQTSSSISTTTSFATHDYLFVLFPTCFFLVVHKVVTVLLTIISLLPCVCTFVTVRSLFLLLTS